MSDLAQLPNVGPTLARELRAAGIENVAHLRELGAAAAWERVRDVNPERDCANSLLALEGALRGVRWMSLNPDERRRLSEYAESRRRPR